MYKLPFIARMTGLKGVVEMENGFPVGYRKKVSVLSNISGFQYHGAFATQ